MSELTPRTRMEVFLAEGSEARITPVTRAEHILAGEDIEPVTRIEFFMKEAASGGGGGDIDVESLTATENKTYTAPEGKAYSPVTVNVPASAVDSGTKNITANGNGQDVVGYASVDVAVPNTYAAGDEGKVVHNGALVSQTSDTVTSNNTYDTTLINSLTVNVSGGGATNLITGSFTTNSESGVQSITVPYSGSGYPIICVVNVKNGIMGNSTFNNTAQRYAIGAFVAVKQDMTTAPTYNNINLSTDQPKQYAGVNVTYKNNATTATTYQSTGNYNQSTANATRFFCSTASTSPAYADAVCMTSGTTLNVFVAGTSYGLMANTEYEYRIVYSS